MRKVVLAVAAAVCLVSSVAFASSSNAINHSIDKGPCFYVKNGHKVMWESGAGSGRSCHRMDNRQYWRHIGTSWCTHRHHRHHHHYHS